MAKNDPAAGKGAADDDKTTAAGADGNSDRSDVAPESTVEYWKGRARQHEDLWKSTGLTRDELPNAKVLLKAAKDADEKSKTAEDRITALEREIAESKALALRMEIASAKGLSTAMAKRLAGTNREELEADADELLKVMRPADDKAGDGAADAADKGSNGAGDSRARPTESLRSGAAPQTEPEDNDPTKLAALIPRG